MTGSSRLPTFAAAILVASCGTVPRPGDDALDVAEPDVLDVGPTDPRDASADPATEDVEDFRDSPPDPQVDATDLEVPEQRDTDDLVRVDVDGPLPNQLPVAVLECWNQHAQEWSDWICTIPVITVRCRTSGSYDPDGTIRTRSVRVVPEETHPGPDEVPLPEVAWTTETDLEFYRQRAGSVVLELVVTDDDGLQSLAARALVVVQGCAEWPDGSSQP